MSDINKLNDLARETLNSNDEPSNDARWYVIHTKPRQEHIATHHLQNQGFEVYFPRVSVQKRKNHQIVEVVEPYFPRYMFVRFNEQTDNWGPIRSTRGVSSLVRFNGHPQALRDELILALKDCRNSQGLQRLMPLSWSPGDVLDIEEGPFAGYRCLFEAERSCERVAVLLDIIGKQTRAVINKRDLPLPQFV